MLDCDKYRSINFPHGITVDDGQFCPPALIAVDMHCSEVCFIVTKDSKLTAREVLNSFAPDMADIAESMAIECWMANDVWSEQAPLVRIESNV